MSSDTSEPQPSVPTTTVEPQQPADSSGDIAREESGAADTENASTAADVAGQAKSEEQSRRNIRIGSQRSATDYVFVRPDETQPDEPAETVHEQHDSTEEQTPAQDGAPAPSEPASTTMPVEVSAPPPVIPETPLDLDREVEEALDGVSLDELMAKEDVEARGEPLEEGSRHKAIVVKVHRDDVFCSISGRHEGVVSLRQFKRPPEPGAMMDIVVTGHNDEDGLYELSIPGATSSVADWSDLAEGMVVDARITGSNTGGLECMIHNIRGFIPASQIAIHRVDNLVEYIGQKMPCIVTEANPRRRNLVLSHRAVLERQREEERQSLIDQMEVGQVREGVVAKLRDFGAFVDLGGIDGLIHISKMSWDRVEHPRDMFEVGQRIQVKIEKVDAQTGKIGLSYRDLLEHPWSNVEQKFPINSVVTGTVSRIANFGAFIRLAPGIEGLAHISELAHQRVASVGSVLSDGQEVEAKVLSVDPEAQRIALSLKAIQPAPEPEEEPAAVEQEPESPRVRKSSKHLKGGTDRNSGGEKFGLKW